MVQCEIIAPERRPQRATRLVSEATPTVNYAATFARREDAYQMIKQVADYLAHAEPQSPVSYLLYRAHAWGHTPLPGLLSELINSNESARRLRRQLGVLP